MNRATKTIARRARDAAARFRVVERGYERDVDDKTCGVVRNVVEHAIRSALAADRRRRDLCAGCGEPMSRRCSDCSTATGVTP